MSPDRNPEGAPLVWQCLQQEIPIGREAFMRRWFVVAALTTALTMLLVPSTSLTQQSGPNLGANQAVVLLNESYALSNQMDDSQQAYYLVDLTQQGMGIVPSERMLEWCKALFRLASQLKEPWDRSANQKNAIVALSRFNPELAMEIFPQVDPPPTDKATLREDVRANAANTIFGNFWKAVGSNGLSEIENQSRTIAKTGQYPYAAIAHILGEMEKTPDVELHKMAADIFREALEFYKQETSRFENRDEEFLQFFIDRQDSQVTVAPKIKDVALLKDALHAFVDNLMEKRAEKQASFGADIYTSNGLEVSFTDRNKAFLFFVFPLIQKLDAPWAANLMQRNSSLALATRQMSYLSKGFVNGNPTAEEAAHMHDEMWQNSLVAAMRDLYRANPRTAIQKASELTDPAKRIEGFSWIITGMAQTDVAGANRLYSQEISELQNLTNGKDKLHALVALARAADAIHDSENFKTFSFAALDLGAQLFEQDSRIRPTLRTNRRDSYQALKEIARFGTAHGLGSLVTQIRQIPDIALKAYLLISAAQGMDDATRSPSFSLSTRAIK
jgi:hypothetical protein